MIKVYSTSGCPMCDMLKEELEEHNIQFENIMDLDTLKNKQITHVPVLELEDGSLLKLHEALKWVNNYG